MLTDTLVGAPSNTVAPLSYMSSAGLMEYFRVRMGAYTSLRGLV